MVREKLTERRVAEAAFKLIDEKGLEGFTMRKLADSIGASTMAVYTYFPDKEALLTAVAQLLLAEVEAPAEDLDWQEVIRRIMRSVREVGHRHARTAPLITRFPPRTPDALAFVEAGFRAFRRAGFDDLSTARCYRALAAYSIGSLENELNGYFTRHPASEASGSLDEITISKHLPHVAQMGPALSGQDDATEFEYGLDLMLTGFADAMAKARQ
jgi:AcrR family transcriptional regulator